jgi:pyruvate/2-oxoglutarate dehydrogenase complex dihydrolipoamide acyltransferase (E2) component
MSGEIIIPELGESIHDVRVARWFKQAGEIVKKDDYLVEIESEKATVVLPAPQAGRLASVLVETGAEAKVGQVIGQIEAVAQATRPVKKSQPDAKAQPEKEATRPTSPPVQPAPGYQRPSSIRPRRASWPCTPSRTGPWRSRGRS